MLFILSNVIYCALIYGVVVPRKHRKRSVQYDDIEESV